MEWYYKPHHPEYVGAGRKASSAQAMEFIYPSSGTILYLPRQLSGEVEGVVFRVAHHRSDATLWWHLDQSFVGETRFIRELLLAPPRENIPSPWWTARVIWQAYGSRWRNKEIFTIFAGNIIMLLC